jgi:hypothetical protein
VLRGFDTGNALNNSLTEPEISGIDGQNDFAPSTTVPVQDKGLPGTSCSICGCICGVVSTCVRPLSRGMRHNRAGVSANRLLRVRNRVPTFDETEWDRIPKTVCKSLMIVNVV